MGENLMSLEVEFFADEPGRMGISTVGYRKVQRCEASCLVRMDDFYFLGGYFLRELTVTVFGEN
jgi:hypothetical protein